MRFSWLLLVLGVMVGLPLVAQEPDYRLSISESSGDVGGTATVTVSMTNTGEDLQGYQWGVCHDDLVSLASGFVDLNGEPTLFTHTAAEHTSAALQPLHERTVTLFVPVPEDAVGPIDVAARLRFRSLGPFLLRLLELDEWLDHLVITDIDAHSAQVSLSE